MLDILEGVLINIITIMITTVCFVICYVFCYSVQRCTFMKDVRRLKKPCNRVLESKKLPTKFVIVETQQFNRLLSDEEQRTILEADAKGKRLFNGKSVRLCDLHDDVASLEEVGFFDFMTTNLVVRPNSRARKSAFANLYGALFSDKIKQVMQLEHRIKAAVKGQPCKTFDDVLEIAELANVVTVSVVLYDSIGRALIVHRGNKVAVSSGSFATSCAGSVAVEDLYEADPFLACAQRELQEELGLMTKLKLDSLVISKQKLQPAALLSGKLDCKFEDVYSSMITAPDFNEENSELFAVPIDKLAGVVKKYQFTDVAAFQLAGRSKEWYNVRPVCIEPYRLA